MALRIKLYGEIENGTSFFKLLGGEETTCSAELIENALNDNPDEKDIHIDIHSPGGSMHEGFAIYDVLRTSGRTIHTNIVGSCHSMAVTVLLAAPVNRRTANINARSLIHRARAYTGGAYTEEELRDMADATKMEEDEMVKVYVQRTKLSEKEARDAVNAEKVHTAQDLLRMGFIGSINSYTTNKLLTNQKNQKMKKPVTKPATSVKDRISSFLLNAANLLSPVNFSYEDAEGNELFSTASQEDDLAVGSEVAFNSDETGGVFNLADGRVVTIADYTVTEIETESEETANLRTENEALREQLVDAVNLIEELQGQIGSNYTPKARIGAQPTTASRGAKKVNAAAAGKDTLKEDLKNGRATGFGHRGIHAPRK